jgi:hypothetical protein
LTLSSGTPRSYRCERPVHDNDRNVYLLTIDFAAGDNHSIGQHVRSSVDTPKLDTVIRHRHNERTLVVFKFGPGDEDEIPRGRSQAREGWSALHISVFCTGSPSYLAGQTLLFFPVFLLNPRPLPPSPLQNRERSRKAKMPRGFNLFRISKIIFCHPPSLSKNLRGDSL